MMREGTLYFDRRGIRRETDVYDWVICWNESGDETDIAFRHQSNKRVNINEYEILISGLQCSLAIGIDVINIIGSNQLVIEQITRVFKVNNPELEKYRNRVLELLEQFKDYTIKWVS